MIKIRKGTFETNSSSVHSLCWAFDPDNRHDNINPEEYRKSYTNVIDLTLSHGCGVFCSFGEKISKLYSFINDDEWVFINNLENKFYKERTDQIQYFDVDEFYDRNVLIDNKPFREHYNEMKHILLDAIYEVTGKKAKFSNESEFSYLTEDAGGFVPETKEEIIEFLLNEQLGFVSNDDYYIADNSLIYRSGIKELIKLRGPLLDKNWFEWFLIKGKK